MEEHLKEILAAIGGFAVVWARAKHRVSVPYASISIVSGQREMHMKGKGLMRARVQIDCFGRTDTEARTVSRAVRTLLEGYRGAMIQGAFLTVLRDGVEGDTTDLQRVSLTFSVTYRD